MRKTIKVILLILTLAAFLGMILDRPASAASGRITTFSLVRADSNAKPQKGKELVMDVQMTNNAQKILTYEFSVTFDSAHFEIQTDGKNPGITTPIASLIHNETVAESTEGSSVRTIRMLGWTDSALESESATILTLSFRSKVNEIDTNFLFGVSSIGIEDNLGSFGVYNLGLNTVSFTKTTIPWWIWLVLGGGILITLVGGYLMMLFFGAVINRFIQRTSKKIAEGSKKLAARTRDLAKGMFNRRPQAPKLKASNAKTSPVQSSGSKPNAKPNSDITKPVTSAKEQKNVTTVKTRMVNPDGSVTTITKKIVDDEPQNKKEL
jgi:hypothetical protein